jgi:general secretion pathway protein K
MKAMVTRTPNSDGYVTLAVLLVVGLLAAIASSLLAVSRPALGLARLGGDEVAAEALLQGGLATAGFLLFGAQRDPSKMDELVVRLHTGEVRISAADEGARVDLNAADSALLSGLFTAVGGKSLSGQAFGNRVVDWRDEDGDVGEDGAESSEYADAELAYGPSNRAFHTVDELRLLLGLSPDDFERLKPFVTVFSGIGKVDPLSASETVLRAIPGAGRREVQQLTRARTSGRTRAQLIELMPEIADYLLEQTTEVYRVRVDVALTNGFREAIEAVIIAPQLDVGAGHQTVAWSRLPPLTESP